MQTTAYDWRISDWSSDVCSSDLRHHQRIDTRQIDRLEIDNLEPLARQRLTSHRVAVPSHHFGARRQQRPHARLPRPRQPEHRIASTAPGGAGDHLNLSVESPASARTSRSEEHTSELQSLMRISYAVFCLKKKTKRPNAPTTTAIHTE